MRIFEFKNERAMKMNLKLSFELLAYYSTQLQDSISFHEGLPYNCILRVGDANRLPIFCLTNSFAVTKTNLNFGSVPKQIVQRWKQVVLETFPEIASA